MTQILFTRQLGSIVAIGLLFGIGIGLARADDQKPTKAVGVSLAESTDLLLEGQIPELKGYKLRIRKIVLEPGAVTFYHSHAHHPVVAYLVSGDYTEHRDGEGLVSHRPGEQWVEDASVAHWSENRGSEATVLINVDVRPVQ